LQKFTGSLETYQGFECFVGKYLKQRKNNKNMEKKDGCKEG